MWEYMGAGCHRSVTELYILSVADGLALIFLINQISCVYSTSLICAQLKVRFNHSTNVFCRTVTQSHRRSCTALIQA